MAELHAKGRQERAADPRWRRCVLLQRRAYLVCQPHLRRQAAVDRLRRRFLAGAFLSVWHDAPERVEDALRLSMTTGANVVECPVWAILPKVDEYKKNIEVRQVC